MEIKCCPPGRWVLTSAFAYLVSAQILTWKRGGRFSCVDRASVGMYAWPCISLDPFIWFTSHLAWKWRGAVRSVKKHWLMCQLIWTHKTFNIIKLLIKPSTSGLLCGGGPSDTLKPRTTWSKDSSSLSHCIWMLDILPLFITRLFSMLYNATFTCVRLPNFRRSIIFFDNWPWLSL